MKHFLKKAIFALLMFPFIFGLTSCFSSRNYSVIPHSISSASAVTVENLNLSKGDYDILGTITESASVLCEYKKNQIIMSGDNGSFGYIFELSKFGWILKRMEGCASLGFFTSDLQNNAIVNFPPQAEEFARRAAMSRLIRATKDYKADGIVEPVIISTANNVGKNKIEYVSTVSAKLISIKTTR